MSSSRPATGSRQTSSRNAVRGLIAPWVLHTGLGPDSATSGFMAQVIAFAVQEGGMPVPRGGGAKLPEALVQLIRDHGGECRLETEVDLDRRRVGPGDRRADCRGRAVTAERAVIAGVTPTQLYGGLLGNPRDPVAAAGRRFRYGRSEMQIHFALSEPPVWRGDERLATPRSSTSRPVSTASPGR